jgi:hypothetical protein
MLWLSTGASLVNTTLGSCFSEIQTIRFVVLARRITSDGLDLEVQVHQGEHVALDVLQTIGGFMVRWGGFTSPRGGFMVR